MSQDFEFRIFEELSHVRETLARNTAILEVNTDQLKEHIRRTEALEAKVDLDRKEIDSKLEQALLPIKTVKALARFSGIVAALSSLAILVYKIVGLFIPGK